MDSRFDLNNEKVDMRKEIKRAKGWAISKLLRRIRNLRKNRGSEAQVAQNGRRAERLVEEMYIMKDLKEDDVFKELLHCKVTPQDLMKSDLTLQQRAVIRIGSASFIQLRMQEIREKISAFQNIRSDKPLPSVFDKPIQCVKNDDSMPNTGLKSQEVGKTKSAKVQKSSSKPSTAKTEKKISLKQNCKQGIVYSDAEDFGAQEPNEKDKTSKNCQRIHERLHRTSDDQQIEVDSLDDSMTHGPNTVLAQMQDRNEEIVIGSCDGYQIVLPSVYKETKQDHQRKSFNDVIQGAEDVTEILPNIGENFDSEEDQNSASDIELEDFKSSALEKKSAKGTKSNECDKACDMFFIDKDQSKRTFERTRTKENSEALDDESMLQVRSCFVESLASVSHQRTKGKNRMSQRARKKLARKTSSDIKVEETTKKTAETDRNANSRTAPPKPIHPSWEASRKRKEAQSKIQEFQGKRICFDESD